MKSFELMLIFGMAAASVASQTTPAQKPSFDVVSVKPNKLGGPPVRMGTEGRRFIAENYPLILLIQFAYRPLSGALLREHVIGGQSWINSDRFDIDARVDMDTRAIPTEQVWLMVRMLLEDRFKLKVHRETRQLPAYDLVMARNGVKMKPSDDQASPSSDDFDDQADALFAASGSPPRGEVFTTRSPSGETVLTGTAIGIVPDLSTRRPHALLPHGLTTLLSGNVGRPVIDKTNLKGLYDFRFQFTPDSLLGNADALGVSIFTAVEQQLGLKLESSKRPVEVIVIDSVERPSEN